MKFDDMIYKEITWFNASEIAEHDTFDGAVAPMLSFRRMPMISRASWIISPA